MRSFRCFSTFSWFPFSFSIKSWKTSTDTMSLVHDWRCCTYLVTEEWTVERIKTSHHRAGLNVTYIHHENTLFNWMGEVMTSSNHLTLLPIKKSQPNSYFSLLVQRKQKCFHGLWELKFVKFTLLAPCCRASVLTDIDLLLRQHLWSEYLHNGRNGTHKLVDAASQLVLIFTSFHTMYMIDIIVKIHVVHSVFHIFIVTPQW